METAKEKKSKIVTLDDLFGITPTPTATGPQIQEIELSKLHEFEGHPFKVLEDQALMDMAESIKEVGQITPAIVRPLEDRPGEYELVSGNRRHRACAQSFAEGYCMNRREAIRCGYTEGNEEEA